MRSSEDGTARGRSSPRIIRYRRSNPEPHSPRQTRSHSQGRGAAGVGDGPDRSGRGHSNDLRSAGKRRLRIAFWLISGYIVAEVIGGVLSGSLALLADAGHMITDAGSIGLALLAMRVAERPETIERTFGHHRSEVLAAMINVLGLWLIAGWVLFEASQRFRSVPEVQGDVLLIVGGVGLAVNLLAAWTLRSAAAHSLNIEGAFRHVMADLYGSIGVVLSGILIQTLGWNIADPILGVAIGLLILYNSRGLTRKVFHVLMEGAPRHLDIYKLCKDIEELEGVTLVHDVHAWNISTDQELMTAHVLVDPAWDGDPDELLNEVRRIAYQDHGLEHITIQVETSASACRERHVGHLEPRFDNPD